MVKSNLVKFGTAHTSRGGSGLAAKLTSAEAGLLEGGWNGGRHFPPRLGLLAQSFLILFYNCLAKREFSTPLEGENLV